MKIWYPGFNADVIIQKKGKRKIKLNPTRRVYTRTLWSTSPSALLLSLDAILGVCVCPEDMAIPSAPFPSVINP
jgi:hypothetical protein